MSAVPPEGHPTAAGEFSGRALSRVIRVFSQPSEVFRELVASPTWLWAIVLIVVFSMGAQAVLVPRVDFEATMRQAMAERPNAPRLTDEQMEKAIAVQKKITNLIMFASPVLVPVMFLLLAGVYFLALKVAGSESDYKPVFASVTHAALPPTLVSSALLGVVAAQRGGFPAQDIQLMLKSNLAAWLDPQAPKALLALARAVDVFNVWQWVLLALGLAIVGKVGRGKATAIVAVLWGLWIAGKVVLAVVF